MIDWFNLAANTLWVGALTLALSILSIARSEALNDGRSLKVELKSHRWQMQLNIAGVLFCGGLSATTAVLWERILWLVLLVLFVGQIVLDFLSARKKAQG